MMVTSIKIEGRFQEGGNGGKSSVMMVNDMCLSFRRKGWRYIGSITHPLKRTMLFRGKYRGEKYEDLT